MLVYCVTMNDADLKFRYRYVELKKRYQKGDQRFLEMKVVDMPPPPPPEDEGAVKKSTPRQVEEGILRS